MRYDQGHYEHAPESAWFNIKTIASIVLEIAEILLMKIGQFAGSASDDKDSPWYMLDLIGCLPLFAGLLALIIQNKQ